MQDHERRIKSLENEVAALAKTTRRYRRGIVSVAVLAIAVVSLSATHAPIVRRNWTHPGSSSAADAPTRRAQVASKIALQDDAITLQNGQGVVIAAITSDTEGHGWLELYDSSGTSIMTIRRRRRRVRPCGECVRTAGHQAWCRRRNFHGWALVVRKKRGGDCVYDVIHRN